jgi:hypothetical protein
MEMTDIQLTSLLRAKMPYRLHACPVVKHIIHHACISAETGELCVGYRLRSHGGLGLDEIGSIEHGLTLCVLTCARH